MKELIKLAVFGVVALAIAWGVWMWGFCRFYVGPNQMAIITSKMGDPLPPGQILANEGQKGIRKRVLGEGRHFYNPVLYDHEIRHLTVIPPGKIGIVTSKVGQPLPEGEFLADHGEKGIWHGALSPGKYRMNPYGYQIDVVDAISVPIGYAGVITSLSGDQAINGAFAQDNQKGIREDVLQPGLYYVNPKQFKIDVLEIGLNQVSLLGRTGGEVITKEQLTTQNVAMQKLQSKVLEQQKKKRMDYLSRSSEYSSRSSRQAAKPSIQQKGRRQKRKQKDDSATTLGLTQFVEFPSRDGFQINLDMTVEFEFKPDVIAWIFSRYGDLPAVVDKIIMPQISSISRNKGSEYRAKDFIVGAGREKFQKDLTQALASTLAQKKLIIHNALIRHVEVPMQILDPIQQASIAIEQDLTNKERQNTAKKLAGLNTQVSLIEQRRAQVAEETKKISAEVRADQEKQVAELKAEALRQVAEIGQETAQIQADQVRILGEADAKAIKLVDGEKAKGLGMKIAAFQDPNAYSLWRFTSQLSDDLDIRIMHTGPGTLWTDLEKAGLADVINAKGLQDR